MKFNTPLLRSLVIITILVLSLVLGLVISTVLGKYDEKQYPREFSDIVSKYSAEYAVPEHIIYAVIKTESDFVSGNVAADGGIGLMGITPVEFESLLKETRENLTADTLYGPETNVRYGTYVLSRLYNSLEDWRLVCSAFYADRGDFEKWCSDNSLLDESGRLTAIPDEKAGAAGEKLYECAEKYREMYYGNK